MKRTKRLIISLLTLFCCSTGAWATGELNGLFTINASGDKVQFSQGNLQYVSSQWQFADNQWSYLNTQSDDNRDLFGWGTANNPNQTSTNNYDYTSFTDWGTKIGDGSTWRTLTGDEWVYLFNTRTTGGTVGSTSQARYTMATIRTDISGVNGIILFPDGVDIANTTDYFATLGTVNGTSAYATKCTSAQWTALETKGCVFLPAAGYRNGTSVNHPGSNGYCWSSSPDDATHAINVFFFMSGSLNPQNYGNRSYGFSVRLVRNYQLQQKCATPTIDVVDGKLVFACDTEDVEYIYNISTSDIKVVDGKEVSFPTIQVSLYATKVGYENSDVVTKDIDLSTIVGKLGDANKDGEISVADVMYIVQHILTGKYPDEE